MSNCICVIIYVEVVDVRKLLESTIDELKTMLKDANSKIWELTEELDGTKELLKEERIKTKSLTSIKNVLEMKLRGPNENENSVVEPHIGREKKKWEDLGSDRKRKVTQKVYDELEKTAEDRRIEPAQLAGSLLHRYVEESLTCDIFVKI